MSGMEVVRNPVQECPGVSGFHSCSAPVEDRGPGPPLGTRNLGAELVQWVSLVCRTLGWGTVSGNEVGLRVSQASRYWVREEDGESVSMMGERGHLSRSSQSSPPHWSRNSSVFMPPTRSKSDL